MTRPTIPLFKVHMPSSVMQPLEDVLMSGFIGQGSKVNEFEDLLSERFNYPYILTLNNCTAGLHMALRMAGVGFGDTVVSTPLTCFATNVPILANGAKIRWADVNPETCNIDFKDVARKVDRDTKAIVFVHWGGYPVDVYELAYEVLTATGGYLPPIIEDCAHAFGATWKGKQVGTFGNYAAFSLQAIKHITTVDGGLLCTPKDQYKRGKLLRWYGIDREVRCVSDFRCEIDVPEWGYKFHMSDVSAVIGIEQMKYVDQILATHRSNATYYEQELASVDGIELLKKIPDSDPSYWLFTFKVERKLDFIRYMKEKGIMTSKVHERNDIHSCVSEFKADLPQLDSINDKIISIPVGWWVSQEDREYIVYCIRQGW